MPQGVVETAGLRPCELIHVLFRPVGAGCRGRTPGCGRAGLEGLSLVNSPGTACPRGSQSLWAFHSRAVLALTVVGLALSAGTLLGQAEGEQPLRVALDRVGYWQGVGAQLSPTVKRLVGTAAKAQVAAAPAAVAA